MTVEPLALHQLTLLTRLSEIRSNPRAETFPQEPQSFSGALTYGKVIRSGAILLSLVRPIRLLNSTYLKSSRRLVKPLVSVTRDDVLTFARSTERRKLITPSRSRCGEFCWKEAPNRRILDYNIDNEKIARLLN